MLPDVSQRDHTGGEQQAQTQEGDGGRVDPERRGRTPERDHAGEDREHNPLGAAERAERFERLSGGGRRCRRRTDLRTNDSGQHERQHRDGADGRHRGGEQPSAKADVDTDAARDLCTERIGRHRRQPQRRRQAQACHARKHEKRADTLAAGLAGLRTRGIGQRERERIKHARARRVAGKRWRDDRVEDEDRGPQAERRSPEAADNPVAAAFPQPALHDGVRDEERHDNEQDRAIAESGVRIGRLQQTGQYRGSDGQDGCRQNRQRVGDHRHDGTGKHAE